MRSATTPALRGRVFGAATRHCSASLTSPGSAWPLLRLNMEAVRADLLEEKLAEITPLLGTPVDH